MDRLFPFTLFRRRLWRDQSITFHNGAALLLTHGGGGGRAFTSPGLFLFATFAFVVRGRVRGRWLILFSIPIRLRIGGRISGSHWGFLVQIRLFQVVGRGNSHAVVLEAMVEGGWVMVQVEG